MKNKNVILTLVLILSGIVDSAFCQSIEERILQDAIRKFDKQEYQEAHKQLSKLTSVLDEKNAVGHYYMARIYASDTSFFDLRKSRDHYERAKKYGLFFAGDIKQINQFEGKNSVGDKAENDGYTGETQANVSETDNEDEIAETSQPQEPIAEQDKNQAAEVRNPSYSNQPTSNNPPEIAVESVSNSPIVNIDRFQEEVDIEKAIRLLPDNEIGRILTKQSRKIQLTMGEERSLHVFRVGVELCINRIGEGRFEEAIEFAEDVKFVAPKLWHGYYLMARLYEANRDFVRASEEIKMANEFGYQPTREFPPIVVFEEPVDQLKYFLSVGTRYINQGRWVEAEDMLMLTQDIEDLTGTDEVYAIFSEVDFRMGLIAFHLEDCSTALDYMQIAIDDGYKPTKADQIKVSDAAECAELQEDTIVDKRRIEYERLRFVGLGGAYGEMKLNIKDKSYIDVDAQSLLGNGRSRDLANLEAGQEYVYLIQGGGAYRVEFDIRNQLKRAAIQGASFLTLLSLLLVFR